MTKALDFLVDNYIYVAGISGFFIVVLIGFLSKENKKTKKELQKETVEQVKEVVPVVEETPIIEQSIIEPQAELKMPHEEPNQKSIVLEKENFEYLLNNKNIETLEFGDHIILDKERLDYEVDIIDFSSLNNFEHNDEGAKPKE